MCRYIALYHPWDYVFSETLGHTWSWLMFVKLLAQYNFKYGLLKYPFNITMQSLTTMQALTVYH